MAFDYSALATAASDLIEEFGRAATLRTITGQTYTPSTSLYSAGTTTDVAVSAVIVGITKDDKEQFGGNVAVDDRMALVADSAPVIGGFLIIGSDTWQIIAVLEVNPGGTALIYKAQVRK